MIVVDQDRGRVLVVVFEHLKLAAVPVANGRDVSSREAFDLTHPAVAECGCDRVQVGGHDALLSGCDPVPVWLPCLDDILACQLPRCK